MKPYPVAGISKRVLFVVLAGSMVNSLSAQEKTHQFSVKQSVEYAVKNSAQVKNALLAVGIQQQTNREITAAAYPQINASVAGTYNPNVATQAFPNFIAAATYGVLTDEGVKDGNGNTIVSPNDFGFINAQFGTQYNANVGVSLSQLLFDGQVFVGLQARRTSIDWSKKSVDVTEENIKANIHKIYYQLVASKTQIELIDANIERLEKLSHDTRELYKNGFAEKLDIDKVDVQIANLRTEKLRALANIQNGYLGLKMLMGMPMTDSLQLTDTLDYASIRQGVLEDAAYRYEDRVEYQYAELGRKLNEYNVKRYKLSQIPTVSLDGGYNKNAQRNTFDFFGKGDWFTISNINLRINIPIFNGFITKSRIDRSKLELQQTQNNIENLKLTIDNEVKTAQVSFQAAIQSLDNQQQNMRLAESVYEQTKKKYEVGTGSNLEITSAQTDLKTAQTNYITSLYDAIIAKINYQKAVGKL
jgi:outer membrane protein TolC